MSTFIQTTDYNASIHAEILDAITRQDDTAIELAEDAAIEEAKGYLSERFDVAAIFAATGDARNKLIVMMCIDIVLYTLHSAHNARTFPEIRVTRYQRAIKWFEDVQAGKITPNGLPLKTNSDATTGSQRIAFGSNTRRETIF